MNPNPFQINIVQFSLVPCTSLRRCKVPLKPQWCRTHRSAGSRAAASTFPSPDHLFEVNAQCQHKTAIPYRDTGVNPEQANKKLIKLGSKSIKGGREKKLSINPSFVTLANNNLFDGESFPKRCSFVEHASMNV